MLRIRVQTYPGSGIRDLRENRVGTRSALEDLMTLHKTHHCVPGRTPIELVGAHLYVATATTDDRQTAIAIVAADDEWKARTCLMLVQTTMRLRGQLVEYQVRQLDTGIAS